MLLHNARLIGIGCLVAMMAAFTAMAMLFTNMSQESARRAYEEERAWDRGAWDPSRAGEIRRKADRYWSGAREAFEAAEYAKAREAFRNAGYYADDLVRTHGGEAFPSGQTVAEWHAANEAAYKDLVAREFPAILDRLGTGEITVTAVRSLVSAYKDLGVEEAYEAARKDLETRRLRRAGRWVRVEFDGDPAYRDALQLGMETAFGGGDGFRLVFGPGLTRREETLTWMTVRARVQERKQRYLEEGGRSGFSLPDSVRVAFDIDKRHEVPTAWDGLQPLSAAVELPEHFRIREGEIRSLAQTEEAAHREKLNNAVQEAAAGLPAFEIAPGVAAESLSVMRDGRLRKKDGHTLALLDPARFEREVRNAAGALAAEEVPALLELIVENDLGELETWVTQMLREADPRLRAELLRAIEDRPWYAEGRPLLALLQLGEPRTVARTAEVLGPLLVDEGVREAFLRQMDRTEGYARETLARVYAERAPIPALELCEEWVTDQNERLAAAVFAALHRRAPELARSTIRLKYDRAPLQVREHMMLVYRFDPATYVRRDGRVVAMALEDEQSATLRRHALKQLYGGVAATPTGWEALQRAAAKEEWGREAPRMRRALVEAVDTAFPDRAEAVYLAELKDSEHNLQAVAVHEAAQFEGETPSVWAELARRARSSDWDAQTWGGALRAIQAGLSGGSLRADNPDLVAVAEAMATHPERTVRWRVVSLLRAALSREGGEGFLPVAEQMARSEPDPKLRRRLERITGSYGKRQRREAE